MLGAMLSTAMIASVVVAGTASVAEAAPVNPYADLSITKLADGTGHGTNNASFVNSKNGFAPGDDTPTDGVVSSNDTVTYEQTIAFSAAGKRDVYVTYSDLGKYLAFESGSVCVAGNIVTTSWDGKTNTCTYSIRAGATETIRQVLVLRAQDTSGSVQEDQGFTVSVRKGSATADPYWQRTVDPVTVVSAPRVDLVLGDPGTVLEPDKDQLDMSLAEGQESSERTLTIKAKTLAHPGYSGTKGASTNVPWSATLDASSLPSGVVWGVKSGGTIQASADGRTVTLNGTGGDMKLTFKFPAMKWNDAPIGTSNTYDLHLRNVTVAPEPDSLPNNGDGTQPGDGKGRDDTTEDAATGAAKGWAYANNDWAHIIVTRPPDYHGAVDMKWLKRPFTLGKSMFDPSNKLFSKAQRELTVGYENGQDAFGAVAPGTQIAAIVGVLRSNIGENPNSTQKMVIGDS
ncbi:RCC1 repeat-containing protein [Bifidobacterium avesanii]|nr:RCC1 repeat-containing protein [Bifidobacterium avesanii]